MRYYKHTLILTFAFLILPTLCEFQIGWGIYRWIDHHESKFQPISDKKIIYSHPISNGLVLEIETDSSIKQQYNHYNISSYAVGEKGKMMVQSLGREIELEFHHINHFTINIKCIQKDCIVDAQKIEKQLQGKQQLKKICKLEKGSYSCKPGAKAVTISITLRSNKKFVIVKQNEEQQAKFHAQNLKNFMERNDITEQPIKKQMVEKAISSLINSICLYRYEDQHYLGFCELARTAKTTKWNYNFRLAPLSLYLLADYSYNLAYEIYQDFFALIETQLLYPIQQYSQVLPLPQHVQIFTRFGTILDQQRQAELLNSFFVVPMLNQLGTLHEQLNYREAKKFHPLLLKMLTQKWSGRSPLQVLKSLYEQSFTEDFKYHDYGQTLDQSIAKNAWIYKVIDTFTAILIKHHSYYMPVEQIKEHLQQHFTLRNIYQIYTNDDNNAKIGKYSDIIDVGENLKLYSKYHGYDSLLVYVYGLGKIFPQAILKQLETDIGIKSSNQERYEKRFRYRGDIHAYFNAKIINGMIYRLQEDKTMQSTKKASLIENLHKLGKSLANKVLEDYKKDKSIFTSWTPDGKGKEKYQWLQIVSVLFLKWI